MYQVDPHLEYDAPPTGTTIGLAQGGPAAGGGGVEGGAENCVGWAGAGAGCAGWAGAAGGGATHTTVVDGCAGAG